MKIEKGIPIPTTVYQYPFKKMEIGDSFFVEEAPGVLNRLRSNASQYARRHEGYKFTVKQVDGGYRCWRIPS